MTQVMDMMRTLQKNVVASHSEQERMHETLVASQARNEAKETLQIFADFVVELSSETAQNAKDDFRWVLSVDGSSNQLGSGAGVILEGPNGVLIEQSLRFAFKASNNQAEYEALISGILVQKRWGQRC